MSVKRIHLHRFMRNLLGGCAVNHAMRRVRGEPTHGLRARIPASNNWFLTVLGRTGRLHVWVSTYGSKSSKVAVRWKLRKYEEEKSLRYDVTRERQNRGRSATRHVCLKRLIKMFNSHCGIIYPKIISNLLLPLTMYQDNNYPASLSHFSTFRRQSTCAFFSCKQKPQLPWVV